MLDNFRSLRKIFWAQHPPLLLPCHSEERSDEESAFPFLVERIRKRAKQMLHFVQHDTTANSDCPKGFGFPLRPLRLCGRYSDFRLRLCRAVISCLSVVNNLGTIERSLFSHTWLRRS